MPPEEKSEVMKCLGIIMGRLESMDKSQSRVTYALIGVIAAQIGVKILGSDPLLDIATAFAFIGSILLLGCLVAGMKLVRENKRRLTTTGKWLVIGVSFIITTQFAVYFRDLGLVDARVIYALRIVQNGALIGLGWNMIHNAELFQPKNRAGG